jgi:hypothetical protein
MTPVTAHLPFSQFVEFAVDPRHQAGLVDALNDRFERFTRTYPGFVCASVQVSEDRRRVLSQCSGCQNATASARLRMPKKARRTCGG